MEILIDYDMTALSSSLFDEIKGCYPTEGCSFEDFLGNTQVAGSLVYCLRQLEKCGISYGFFTRDEEGFKDLSSFMRRVSDVRIFRLMPSCKHFKGFVNDIPESTDVIVTSDAVLTGIACNVFHVIYMGKKKPSRISGNGFCRADCFSQLPMLISDMRLKLAC